MECVLFVDGILVYKVMQFPSPKQHRRSNIKIHVACALNIYQFPQNNNKL